MEASHPSVPRSREVRLVDQEHVGHAEQVAFDIYTGDAGTLTNSIRRLELVMEYDRSRCIEMFARMLRKKLMADGYIVISDIDDAVERWHEDEVLNNPAA